MICFELKECIGQKVIIRSNEISDPYMVGVLKSFEPNHGIPVCEVDGNELMCSGIVFPYSEHLIHMFDKMTFLQQYQWAANIRNWLNMFDKHRENVHLENALKLPPMDSLT